MSVLKAINDLKKDMSALRRRVNKLPSRISNSAGGGGGGSSSRLMIEVETYEDLPEPSTVARTQLYRVRTGTYGNGIAYVYDDGVDPPVWRFLNYWQ